MDNHLSPYTKVLHNAKSLLEDWFDFVDFDNYQKTNALTEILACEALMNAGSSISIRWASREHQINCIGGIESMMFEDIALNPEIKQFYLEKIEPYLTLRGNRWVFS